jgi:hypothetical protein
MSGLYRGLVTVLIAVAFGLFVTGNVGAQTKRSDPLDEYKERVALAAQKLEAEVRAAITEYQKLLPSNPAAAAECLRKVLPLVEEDRYLSDTKRNSLKRDLKDRILLADANASRKGDPDKGVKGGIESARQAEQERRAQEAERIAQQLAQVKELQRQGKTLEAARLADEIQRRNPNNPAAVASGHTTAMGDRVAELRELNAE